MPGITRDTLTFLADLSANNDKAWFDANRKRYDAHFLEPGRELVTALQGPLAELSPGLHAVPKVNGSLMRINRDTRFSRDKRPYKDHLDMMFWEGSGRSRECPGLFFRLTSDTLHLGAGKHGFEKNELAAYREAVAGAPGEELASLLADLVSKGFTVGGAHYKRVPTGFDKEHPRAELLKHNGLHAFVQISPPPAELFGPGRADFVAQRLAEVYPLLAWLVAVLKP